MRGAAVVGGDRAPRPDRLVAAADLDRPEVLDLDPVERQPVRVRPDQHLVRRRALLEARGEVDRLAGGERRVAVADDDLAGLDPDPAPRARALLVVSRIASEARMARSASSSCACGTPNAAITASPANFSTVPPWRTMQSEVCSKNRSTRRRTISGSVVETSPVESTRSTNSTVASLRSIPPSVETLEEVGAFRAADWLPAGRPTLKTGGEAGFFLVVGLVRVSIAAVLDPKVFKAYDVRGLYPDELDEEGACAIGRAYVEQFEPRKIAVGPRHARLVAVDGGGGDRRRGVGGRGRARPRARRHGDGLLRGRRARARRRDHGHRLAQPEGVHRA